MFFHNLHSTGVSNIWARVHSQCVETGDTYIVYIDPTHLLKCCCYSAYQRERQILILNRVHLVQFCFINVTPETADKGPQVITIYHCLIPSMWICETVKRKKDTFKMLWKWISKSQTVSILSNFVSSIMSDLRQETRVQRQNRDHNLSLSDSKHVKHQNEKGHI